MLEVQPYAGGTDVLPQVSWQKSLGSQKNSLDLKKITRFKIFVSKLAVLLEMMY